MHTIEMNLIHYASNDCNLYLSDLLFSQSLHVLQSNMYYYHHNLMPVTLAHVADTIHAESGSTGVASPTTASIIPLLCANNPPKVSRLQP